MEFVSPPDVAADESPPGLARQVVFETDNNVMVKSSVERDPATGWHHRCDRHAYGYLLEGRGTVELGARGTQGRELSGSICFHIPPGAVHREIAETDLEVVVNFVGSGPLVENVDVPDD